MNRFLPFYLAAVCGLLTARTGHAQAQPYRFDLKAEKLDVPAGPWRVTRVLDLRADRSRLGTVRRGLGNELASADFTQALAPELLRFFAAQLPPAPAARPVVLRVFTLALSEDLRANSENAEAELVADFLEPQPDSTFRVLLRVGETTRRGGIEVTKMHPANLALLLQQALRQLAALPAAPAPAAETLSQADALTGRGGAAAQRFAIQTAAAPKRGFYRTLQEFRDNAPSEPDFFFAIEHVPHPGKRWAGTDEVVAYYPHTDERHPRRPVRTAGLWGLSDGKELLMVYRNGFYKLLAAADGRGYSFMGPPLYDAQAAANMAAASVAGGLLGAAIAGAANNARPFSPYELRLASGRVLPAQEAEQTDADGFARPPRHGPGVRVPPRHFGHRPAARHAQRVRPTRRGPGGPASHRLHLDRPPPRPEGVRPNGHRPRSLPRVRARLQPTHLPRMRGAGRRRRGGAAPGIGQSGRV